MGVFMYYSTEEDCIKTMLTGTPLTAEKVIARDGKVGSAFGGTSWFFIMHLIAKSLTRKGEDEIKFDSLHSTMNNYGIHDWIYQRKLRSIEERWISVYNQCGIGNIHLDENGNIIIDGNISKKEFKEFTAKQYNYSMTEGLTSTYPYNYSPRKRPKSDFIERIFWHYITSIYTAPQIYSCPEEDCFLDGLFTDLTEKMEKKELQLKELKFGKKKILLMDYACLRHGKYHSSEKIFYRR